MWGKLLKSISECPVTILSSGSPVGTVCGILVAVVTVLTSPKPLKGVPVCKEKVLSILH